MRRRRRLAALGLGSLLLATAAAYPTPLAGPADTAVAHLSEELRAILGRYPWRGARWSVLVVSLDRGDTLFAVSADSAMAPASNMKLLTSAAALREMGPDFRYRTWLLSDASEAEGVLDGDLGEIVEGLALAHREELLKREMEAGSRASGA